MFALEIINALNDPDNPAKPKGLNAKLKNVPTRICVDCSGPITDRHGEAVEEAKLAPEVVRCYACWDAQADYSGGRFRY